MHKKVTLQEVARLAGVSTGTASQVLNEKDGVLPGTRQKVIQAARMLGYHQRFLFESHDSQKMKQIAVIKHNHYDGQGDDSFYFPVIMGIEQACNKAGISMEYTTIDVDAYNRATHLDVNISERNLDGIVVVGAYINLDVHQNYFRNQHSVVLVDGYSEAGNWDCVLSNNFDGSYRAVSYLIEKGHRMIGLIGTSPEAYPSILERRQGYLNALSSHEINRTYIIDSVLNRDAAYEAAGRLLTQSPEVTAIFVANDNAAIGVLYAARQVGRHVPDDLSIIGFDDISFALDMDPPLTTMHVDKVEMGKMALQRLLYRIENPEAPTTRILLDTALQVRKSVKPVPVR